MLTKNEAVKKIKKCLALSESNNNPEEAQSALLMAQKLMAKYYIDKNDIDNHEDDKIATKFSVVSNKSRLMWYESSLATVIANNFRCISYSTGNRSRGKEIIFLGLEEDVEIAQEVFIFALKKMKKLAEQKIKEIDSNDKKYKSSFKNDFYRGFIDGLDRGFKEQVEQNSWEMVLVIDSLVLKEAESLNLKKVKPKGIPPKFSNNKKLYNEGYKNGKDFGSSFNDGTSLDDKGFDK